MRTCHGDDVFSKFTQAVPTGDQKVSTVAEILVRVVVSLWCSVIVHFTLTKGEVLTMALGGRFKIQDVWGPIIYQVIKAPASAGVVYSIAPVPD